MVTGRREPVVMTVMMIMVNLMSAIMGGCGGYRDDVELRLIRQARGHYIIPTL